MKKVLAIVLMLTMVLSVVGCQANGNNDVKPTHNILNLQGKTGEN